MLVLQVNLTSLIHQMQTKKTLLGKLFIKPILRIFMVEEIFIWTKICQNKEDLITFLKRLDEVMVLQNVRGH